jgi:urease accessory protein
VARGQVDRAVRAHAELRVSAPLCPEPGGAETVTAQCSETPPGGGASWDLAYVRDAPPVAFRATPEAVYLVGTAAFPVGDDCVSVEVEVGAGAALAVRSAASMIAWASGQSRFDVGVTVGRGASLDWQLQPLVASSACHFSQQVRVRLDEGATLLWSEELVLGRHGEPPGQLDMALDVEYAGVPLLRHRLMLGPGAPGWDGPAVMGNKRATGLALIAGSGAHRGGAAAMGHASGQEWAVMALDGPAFLATATGADLLGVRASMNPAVDVWRKAVAGAGPVGRLRP